VIDLPVPRINKRRARQERKRHLVYRGIYIMKQLNMLSLSPTEHLVHPEEFHELQLDSPALSIFTDFKKHQPMEIDADTPATQAEYLMRKAHVRLKLVVDRKEELIGMISLRDLDEQNFMLQQRKGFARESIQVRHLMLPRERIKALAYRDLLSATVGDVVGVLKQNGQQHCLVIDPQLHQIRGLISASDIARRLHIALEVEQAPTFIDIFEACRP
jgi:CBS domain containing-hemolysin-like protein